MKMTLDSAATSLRKKNILLGFSGGADSTAAVLLLRKQGYHVLGFHFSVLGDMDVVQQENEHVDDIARQLDIQVIHKDMSVLFHQNVIKPFCESYQSGTTPNPCVICNPYIKFKALYEAAQELGFSKIATGHYARIWKSCDGSSFLQRAENVKKDQSYVLYRLDKDLLSRTIFPLGDIESKEDIRHLLKKYGASNAEAKDSQDICFIKNSSYKEFLAQNDVVSIPGNYIDKTGRILGKHTGIANYTIGQRKGLGKAFGKPMFVTGLNARNHTVILGEESDLYKESISFSNSFFTAHGDCLKLPLVYENIEVDVKLRYAARPARALLYQKESAYPILKFQNPQKAPTPGQSAVLYVDDIVIGGGIIL